MEVISKQILESRKAKGYSQDQLAELSQVNLRTIQRIENQENEPRGKTLQLICEALDLNIEELNINKVEKKNLASKIATIFFLLILNVILMLIAGILTLGAPATLEIRTGAFLLSFFIPFFIVWKTQNMSGSERLIKFGTGYIFYFISTLFTPGFIIGFVTCLYPCLFICLCVLFYGKEVLVMLDTKS
jgi:transcriptional regulator with XRE-family HTH domain